MTSDATSPTIAEMYPAGIPRINHVAMSVAPDLLRGDDRAELLRFYDECFGWKELEEQAEEGKIAVLTVGHWDQFVFLHAEDEPMAAPRLDHFGVSVQSMEDFGACWDRVSAWADKDARVDTIDPSFEDHEVLLLHGFYVRFRLPLMVEVQYWQFR